MALPGVVLVERDLPPPRSSATDTGVWLTTGLTERGTTTAQLVTSLADFRNKFGARVTYSVLSDAVETYFAEGGGRAYVSRVLGPTPVTAGLDLSDGTAATLRVSALGAGEYGNAYTVQVVAGSVGGTFVLVIASGGVELERSPDLLDTAAAITWADSSSYVRASELAGVGNPVVSAAAALTGGTDDRTNAGEADWTAALARFGRALGPGQVSAPGRTTQAAHTALLAHAQANNRVAILDAPDTTTAATLRAAAAALRSLATARHGALFAPWVNVRGLVAGTTRAVPYSAVQAGLISRQDRVAGPNEPAAGSRGESFYSVGPRATFTDADLDSMNTAGVNIAKLINGVVTTYGYRTLVDPIDLVRLSLGSARLIMDLRGELEEAADAFVFRQIDGRGKTLSEFAGALTGVLLPHYAAGELYGDTPDEAFRVEVGAAVNTPETIAAGELHAAVALRISTFGEVVRIEITRVALTEGVA